jgi:hypothetical protein
MRILPLLLLSLGFVNAEAQQRKARPVTRVSLPASAAIRPSELERDLAVLSSDSFRGREAGTIHELSASVWLAEQARMAGLEPAGDNGTFFQFFSMKRHRIAPSSFVRVGNTEFQLWKDALITQTAPAIVDAPVLYLGSKEPAEVDSSQVRGKAVVIEASPRNIDLRISLPERRYPGFVLRKYAPMLINNGAAAIIFIADSVAEKSWQAVMPAVTRGVYDIEEGPNATISAKAPVIWLHRSAAALLQENGARLKSEIHVNSFDYPSVNVVGKIRGADQALSKEYVLYSGHQDHDGVRTPYGSDSIYNGADDNGTMTVAMLAIARAFKAKPGARSALFVWHGAEERGLLGSRWFAGHPTVPKGSIVAVLNGDMIGRNHPDTAALLGSTVPHRNSPALVAAAIKANDEGPKFVIDSSWDDPAHPEFWYFRSDHLPYARAGVPALFFSSLLHDEYHTPMDEAKTINLQKLTRMTQWLYRTGWIIASDKQRPDLDPQFKLER